MKKIIPVLLFAQIIFISQSLAVPDGTGTEVLDSQTGNTTSVLRIKNTAGDFDVFRTDATPEASVTGSVGDIVVDSTGGSMYLKTSGAATNTGWSAVVTGSSATTLQNAYDNDAGTPADITMTSTDGPINLLNGGGTPIISGSMFTINQSNAAASANPMTITNTGPSDALNITHSSAVAGNVFDFSADGTLGGTDDMIMDRNGNIGIGDITPDALLDIDSTATTGNLFGITNTGVYTGSGLINVVSSSTTSGTGQAITMTGLTTGTGLHITGGASMATGSRLINLTMGTATGGNAMRITNTGVYTDTGIIDLVANGASSGVGQAITMNALTTGKALNISSSSTAITSADLISATLSGDPSASWTGDLAAFEVTGNNANVDGNALKVGVTTASTAGSASTALNVTTAGPTGAFALRVNDDGTYTDATPLVVDNTGAVGIGVTTASSILHVDSNAANTVAIQTLENTAGDIQLFRTDATPEAAVTGSIGDIAVDSTGGAVYFKTSGSSTNTGWDHMPVILDRDVTVATITTATPAFGSAYTFTVPAGVMGTNRSLRLTLMGNYINNSGAARTLTMRVQFGGVTQFQDVTLGVGVSAGRRPFYMQMMITNLGAANSQMIAGTAQLGNIGATTNGIGDLGLAEWNEPMDHSFGISTLGTVNTAAASVLDVAFNHPVAGGATLGIAIYSGVLELL